MNEWIEYSKQIKNQGQFPNHFNTTFLCYVSKILFKWVEKKCRARHVIIILHVQKFVQVQVSLGTYKRCLLTRIVQGTIKKTTTNKQPATTRNWCTSFVISYPCQYSLQCHSELGPSLKYHEEISSYHQTDAGTFSYILFGYKKGNDGVILVSGLEREGNPVGFTLSKAALPSTYDAIISVGQIWLIQTTVSFLHTHPEDASHKDRFQLESPFWQGRF